MLNKYLRNIELKVRQIISLLGAPTYLGLALGMLKVWFCLKIRLLI
jgi:hypothetical protein